MRAKADGGPVTDGRANAPDQKEIDRLVAGAGALPAPAWLQSIERLNKQRVKAAGGGLADQLGTGDIGSQPYVPPPRADINGPIDPAAVQSYLARTGQIYPTTLPKVNPQAWDKFIESRPNSLNVEDRRTGAQRREDGVIAKALREAEKKAAGGSVIGKARGGGTFHVGAIHGSVPGRTDKIPRTVPGGSYVFPADFVSGQKGAQNNTNAGFRLLNARFKMGPYGTSLPHIKVGKSPRPVKMPRVGRLGRAEGGATEEPIEIIAASGEFTVPPHKLQEKHPGMSLEAIHKMLDEEVVRSRKGHIKTLHKLPRPKTT